MNLDHPDNHGKYRLALTLLNGGSVTYGPWFDKKKEAQEYLAKYKKRLLFGFDEGYALMHLIAEKFRQR